jgi:hypothetical protein
VTHRLHEQEEGQIIPALLLVVVVLLFFGLLFAQVGSAAEQKTQTQTAADSAAVAAAHQLRDSKTVEAAHLMPYWFGRVFNTVIQPVPQYANTACSTAQFNWSSNPHGGTSIDCATSLLVTNDLRAVHVDLTTPRDQVTHGPVDVSDDRARAIATARVSMSHCPRGLLNYTQKAVADWVADSTLMALHARDSLGSCLPPSELTYLENLDKNTLTMPAVLATIGPPEPILTAVRNGLYAELVD